MSVRRIASALNKLGDENEDRYSHGGKPSHQSSTSSQIRTVAPGSLNTAVSARQTSPTKKEPVPSNFQAGEVAPTVSKSINESDRNLGVVEAEYPIEKLAEVKRNLINFTDTYQKSLKQTAVQAPPSNVAEHSGSESSIYHVNESALDKTKRVVKDINAHLGLKPDSGHRARKSPDTTDGRENIKESKSIHDSTKASPALSETVSKKLILILDATDPSSSSSKNTGDNTKSCSRRPLTNLKRLCDSLTAQHKESGMRQLVYYANGCGSGADFGLNYTLYQTVLDAYSYLSDNWEPEDEVYIFGFSHGAYAARALAALITEFGLFNKAGMVDFDTLYQCYFGVTAAKIQKTKVYERWRSNCEQFSFGISLAEGVVLQKVSVKFLGCLDTIGWGSFDKEPSPHGNKELKLWKKGYGTPSHLLLNEDIEYAFHALALDEERASHTPLLMFRARDSKKPLRQIWFTGSHTNIGGGPLSHDLLQELSKPKPDRNELSDIVFLCLISECYELLTFSRKHINERVADYFKVQTTTDLVWEDAYRGHWAAGKIDKPWSKGLNIAVRFKNKTRKSSKHIRIPLRYRPHWFDDEAWIRYTSSEAVHASCKYRRKFFPDYRPKSLVGFMLSTILSGSSGMENTTEETPSPAFVHTHPEDEKLQYENPENSATPFYCGDISLPIIPMCSFEILTAGGGGLLFGFGISYRNIYRETPPVFHYTKEYLQKMQETWVLQLVDRKRIPDTPVEGEESLYQGDLDRSNAEGRHGSRSLRLKDKHEENGQRGIIKRTISMASIKSTISSIFRSSQNLRPGTRNHQISVNGMAEGDHIPDESGTGKGKGKHSAYNAPPAGSDPSSEHLPDESGTGKGKGKHSTYSQPAKPGARSFADMNSSPERDTTRTKLSRETEDDDDMDISPPLGAVDDTNNDSTEMLNYETDYSIDSEILASNDDTSGLSQEIMDSEEIQEEAAGQASSESPSRVPEQFEWERRLNEPGVVHPCKFKIQKK